MTEMQTVDTANLAELGPMFIVETHQQSFAEVLLVPAHHKTPISQSLPHVEVGNALAIFRRSTVGARTS
jgi:hypothetical protein